MTEPKTTNNSRTRHLKLITTVDEPEKAKISRSPVQQAAVISSRIKLDSSANF